MEQLLLVRAMESIQAESDRATAREERARHSPQGDPFSPEFVPDEHVVLGAEAESIADKPLLTGNAEWDAVELAETDPLREPLDSAFAGRFLKGVSRGN